MVVMVVLEAAVVEAVVLFTKGVMVVSVAAAAAALRPIHPLPVMAVSVAVAVVVILLVLAALERSFSIGLKDTNHEIRMD
jgi:hypothetical protein